jgi:predicted transcriptional regulator
MEGQNLVELTADIVAAHVSNNHVSVGDVSTLIEKVHEALALLGRVRPPEQQEKTPIVSVRASLKPDYIV